MTDDLVVVFHGDQAEVKQIAPLLNGTCHACGKAIKFVFVGWCEDCMDAAKDIGIREYCQSIGHTHG